MWIEFKSTRLYLIRLYVNGNNAVTGRNDYLPTEQDYVVVPGRIALDWYKPTTTTKVQFTCPPSQQANSGVTNRIELQFEITPYDKSKQLSFVVKDLWGVHGEFRLAMPSGCTGLYVRTAVKYKTGGMKTRNQRLGGAKVAIGTEPRVTLLMRSLTAFQEVTTKCWDAPASRT